MRAFIAILLPEELHQRLDALIGRLRSPGDGARWIPASAIHLTVKFLGEISLSAFESIPGALEDVLSRIAPFRMTAEGVGAFPGWRRPRVLWVGLRGGPELHALQAGVEEELDRVGFPRETRDFSPHLTIARLKAPGGSEPLARRAQAAEFPLYEFRVDSLSVMESTLTPRGAIYTPRRILPLGGPGGDTSL